MYVVVDETGRAESMCSVRQADTDLAVVEPDQDMYDNLPSYVYDPETGQFVKDATYAPPPLPKTALEQMQEDLERQAAALQDLILMTMGGE